MVATSNQSAISPFVFTQIYLPAFESIVSILEGVALELREYAKVDTLDPAHIEHLHNEGFSLSQIALWVDGGLRSLTKEEAEEAGFKVKGKDGRWSSGSGLLFPFTKDFSQLRLDTPAEREKGKQAKYLTPLGAKTQARIPRNCKVITEGAKDAAAGSLHGGIPTGAIAGISHYRKALKQNAGYTVLFDADVWINPNVFSNLLHGGKWLNSKVQAIPKIEGCPKAGLVEFFKAGKTAADYKELVDSAKKPEDFLLDWGKHFGDIPEAKLSQAIRTALRLAAEYLDEVQQDILLNNIKSACPKITGKTLNRELKKQRATVKPRSEQGQQPEADDHPEAFYRPICKMKRLPFEHCVTAGSFDSWAYYTEFGATEGDWRVIDAAFYRWIASLGYWEHQPDNRVNTLIADAGDKAFKLKHSKEFGWQVTFPYGTNGHKESAFKYSRSRLERPEPLPNNTHLRAFRNCVVDMRTGAVMPHNKDYFLTSIIPYPYQANKECPEVFRQFVADSFGEDMLPIIRAFTSMFLDPTAPYGRFPHLIGQSGAGKGSMGRFWSSLFGEDGASGGDFSNLSTAEGRHQYLTGKSIFAIPDAGGYVQGLRAFYELVDNGGLSGRALFSPTGYFRAWNMRFWVASVDHLQIENCGDGWSRRAYPIPVKARRVKPDPDLRLKLEAVKADVISWALSMPREERDRILLSPPTNERVINLTMDSALYGDSTKSFVDLCLRPSANPGFMPNHLLHTLYSAYCQQHGYTPLGMSKFISHLKTILPRNFVDRHWAAMVDGKRDRVAAHWEFIAPLPNAFIKSEVEIENDPFNGRREKNNPTWICIKSACEEGGLMDFEDFWQPPQPPQSSILLSDNNFVEDNTPLPPPIPAMKPEFVQGVQGVQENAESLKQRNSGGVQGVQGVQGIGFGKEKNEVCVAEKILTEKILTPVTMGGQWDSTLDSFEVCQKYVKDVEVREVCEVEQFTAVQSEIVQDAAIEEDPWMNEEQLNAIANDLNECPDPETLDALRQCWNPVAMNAACKRLSPERHAQIKAWVLALNAATADDAATVATGVNAVENEELVQAELFLESQQEPRRLSLGDWEWEV
jgi:hypothetical protein